VLLVAGNYLVKVKVMDHVQCAVLAGILSTVCAVLIYYQLDLYLSDSLERGNTVEDFSLAGAAKAGFWLVVISSWLTAWLCVDHLASIHTLSRFKNSFLSVLTPIIFGVWLLLLWEFITRGAGIPQVLLPAPSAIGHRFVRLCCWLSGCGID